MLCAAHLGHLETAPIRQLFAAIGHQPLRPHFQQLFVFGDGVCTQVGEHFLESQILPKPGKGRFVLNHSLPFICGLVGGDGAAKLRDGGVPFSKQCKRDGAI